jgi:hypothetical protein
VLFELLRPYRDIVRGVRVDRFRSIEAAHELRAHIVFRDASVLHVRDYVFRDGTRKYAYHWQTAAGQLRRRWDNSGHWPEIASHPHHVHVERATTVQASPVRDLSSALAAIFTLLRQR